MKKLLLLLGLFALINIPTFAQTTLLSDDFESGALSSWTDSESHWAASTTSPINGTYSLKHDLSSVSGSSLIYSSVTAEDISTKVTTWKFNMKNGSWDPSGSNYFGVVLIGDEQDPTSGTFNGYVVGINFSGTSDLLTLYEVTTGTYSAIITSALDWGSSDLVGIQVSRSTSGSWELSYDSDGDFDNLTSAGTVTDTDHTTFSYSSIYFEYTATRAGDLWIDDFLIQQEDESLKAEPDNYPTSFSVSSDIRRVDISWTDATGTVVPDGYLIKASNVSYAAITDPVDNTAESDDSDLSDGAGVLNISDGYEAASFTNLDETTTYYFKIYSYSNSGSDIEYKTDGTPPQDDATTPDTPDIVLNEFLADPASGADPNGDTTPSTTDDEFIEFVNFGTSDLDISNWTIEDEGGTTHTFSESTVLKPFQAVVVFGGGTPTGSFGGSIVQTASSLSLNNSGDDIILKNSSGIEILSYTYGSEANSDESVTRSPDITGDFEQHETADTPDASAYSPGTRIDGTTFNPSITFTGSEGWRILSAPTSNNTYDDLLADIWTQGIASGADATSGTANIQTFNGSSFSGISDMDATMSVGVGFITYVYSDDDYENSGADTGFPKTVSMYGTENSGTVSPSLTSGADAWTLVGNPFLSTIDYDGLTMTDLTDVVYVYDHSYGTPSGEDTEATGSAGSYRVWNGTAGSLTDGLIAPIQGFWVQNGSSGTPSLGIPESAKTIGGTFYKAVKTPVVELKVEQDGRYSTAYFSFTADGELTKDGRDALKLLPLDHKDYISISSLVGDTEMDINNLPAELDEEVQVALNIKSFDAIETGWAEKAGEFTIRWPQFENIPEDWKITLTDHETGQSIDLRTEESYSFQVTEVSENIMEKSAFSMLSPVTVTKQKGAYDDRFLITITPNFSIVDIEENSSPEEFTLSQNYPNPFNPSTNIRYSVAEPGNVSITVYNLMGQKVAELVNETKAAGSYNITWNATQMASGMYYYRLTSAGQTLTRKMTLIK